MIRDQHNGYIAGKLPTVADVEHFWSTRLAVQGISQRDDPRLAVAYVNDSRWVADCPECAAGMLCASDNARTCCLECGRLYAVAWPEDAEAIVAALSLRPRSANRNWKPGEPVTRLLAENDERLRA